MTLHAYIGF